jgi:hypothetical protein
MKKVDNIMARWRRRSEGQSWTRNGKVETECVSRDRGFEGPRLRWRPVRRSLGLGSTGFGGPNWQGNDGVRPQPGILPPPRQGKRPQQGLAPLHYTCTVPHSSLVPHTSAIFHHRAGQYDLPPPPLSCPPLSLHGQVPRHRRLRASASARTSK